MPTGSGKSYVLGALAAGAVAAELCTVVVLPSRTLLAQTAALFRSVFNLHPALVGDGHNESGPLVLTTWHSAAKVNFGKCKILMVDECHLAASATAQKALKRAVNTQLRVGVSATPWPSDAVRRAKIAGLLGPLRFFLSLSFLRSAGVLSQASVTMHAVSGGGGLAFCPRPLLDARVAQIVRSRPSHHRLLILVRNHSVSLSVFSSVAWRNFLITSSLEQY